MNQGNNNEWDPPAWASAFFESSSTSKATEDVPCNLPVQGCSYRDFSTYIEDGGRIEKHKKSDRNFPARLHAMLSNEQYSNIISWMPHGRAWRVLDKRRLVEEVIPKYFGQTKYNSFTRQLSGWGFRRLKKGGPDVGCYYHECFLRGHPRLTVLMRRISNFSRGRATPNVYTEPDFCTIAKKYPLHTTVTSEKPACGVRTMEEDAKLIAMAKASSTFQQMVTSNLLPVARGHYSFESSTSHYEASASQSHGDQYMSKTQDVPSSEHVGTCTAPMNVHNFHGVTENLYQIVKARSECHEGTANQQHCIFNSVQRTCPSHLRSQFPFQGDPLLHNRSDVGYDYGSMDLYSSISQQQQAQGQEKTFHGTYSADSSSHPHDSFQYSSSQIAITEDSSKRMHMSVPVPEHSFPSLEDSFYVSPFNPTKSYSG